MGEIFISYASADGVLAARVAEGVRQASHRIFMDSDREDGVAPGAAWQKTLLRELRLCDAVVFLNSSASQASMWCHSELVVATELGKRVYSLDLASDVRPHPLLRSLQGIRFETTIDASIQRLTDNLGLDGLAQSTRFKWERGRAPYPGLAAMDVADAGVFFGREEEVRSLVARVDGPLGQPGGNLVVVMGPSGAGKSSLVRAGLVARLAVPRSGWVVAGPFEPGTRPLGRLASRLAALVPGQLTDGECRDRLLSEGIGAVSEWLADHMEFPAKRLLITVDQAEQLATVTPPQDSGEFPAVLGEGLGAGSPVTVVMTVRSDRLDEIQRLPVIGPMIHAPFVIAPMSRSQLAAVIEGPAGRADLAFAPGLAGRLIDDAVRGSSGEAADALPFLAFTLREMYDLAVQEDRGTFTDADYERVGRIEGAIIRRTEAAESLLPPDSGPVLDRLLPRFVTLSEDRLPAGRPVPRERLTAAEQAIVEKLEDQRLLTGTGDTVRLAHEQLITAWPRLAQTVADRRDDLLLQARIERQANDWKHGNGELLGRDATTTASSWLAGRAEPGTDRSAVGDYIRASRRALRRRRARLVGALSTIVALALAASVVAVVAGIQSSNAVRQRNYAESAVVAAVANTLYASNPALAKQLSLAAYNLAPSPEAYGSLLNATGKPIAGQLAGNTPALDEAAFNANGSMLATSSADAVQLWRVNATDPTDLTALTTIHSIRAINSIPSLRFDPGRSTTLAILYGRHASLENTDYPYRFSASAGNPRAPTHSDLALSRNGRLLAIGQTDGSVRLWNVADLWNVGHPRIPAIGHPFRAPGAPDNIEVSRVALSADGSILATVSGPIIRTILESTETVRLWDIADPAKPRLLPATLTSAQTLLAFSPVGHILATGSTDNSVQLWNVTNPSHPTPTGPLLSGHTGTVFGMVFSADGHTMATASLDGSVRLWNVADSAHPRALAVLRRGPSIVAFTSVAISPDSHLLAAAGFGFLHGSVVAQTWLWKIDPGRAAADVCAAAGTAGSPITQAQWRLYFPGVAYSPPCPARNATTPLAP